MSIDLTVTSLVRCSAAATQWICHVCAWKRYQLSFPQRRLRGDTDVDLQVFMVSMEIDSQRILPQLSTFWLTSVPASTWRVVRLVWEIWKHVFKLLFKTVSSMSNSWSGVWTIPSVQKTAIPQSPRLRRDSWIKYKSIEWRACSMIINISYLSAPKPLLIFLIHELFYVVLQIEARADKKSIISWSVAYWRN